MAVITPCSNGNSAKASHSRTMTANNSSVMTMRHINGITGCAKGKGIAEIESEIETSVRVIDCQDRFVALRIGAHDHSARLTPEQARHVATLLIEAAERA